MNWRGYICGTMNGLGAGWITMGISKPSTVLFSIGIATFVGQWVVQYIWLQIELNAD